MLFALQPEKPSGFGFTSVFIRVHPWLKRFQRHERRFATDAHGFSRITPCKAYCLTTRKAFWFWFYIRVHPCPSVAEKGFFGFYQKMTITQNSKLKTQNWADWHCHLLPNLDDGAKDLADSLAIAEILAKAGFSEVHCTPHSISGAYEASPERIRQATRKLQEAIDGAGIPLRVSAGSEYYCDEFLPARLDDPLTLGDSNMVLMEAPLQATPTLLSSIAYQVTLRGHTPLIAHPERCALFQPTAKSASVTSSLFGSVLRFANARFRTQNSASNLEPRSSNIEHDLSSLLTSMGCRFQGNLGSFAGIYGERVRKTAINHLQNGLYDCLGSDAHASRGLASWLQRGLCEVESHVGAEGLAALLAGPVTMRTAEKKITFA